MVTNDDGIESPGIWALAEALSHVGNVLIVAPDKQQSGVGTSLSFHNGMKISEVSSRIQGVRAYAIGGTPSDCVIIGLRRLAESKIDMIASGINYGANMGRDIPYSGTVMPTLQAYFRKIPSMAISLVSNSGEELLLDTPAKVAALVAISVKNGEVPEGSILNINVPNLHLEHIKGIVATRAASTPYVKLSASQKGNSVDYVKTPHGATELKLEEGTDIWATAMGCVSITPIKLEVTNHQAIPALGAYALKLKSSLAGTINR